jgi:hypothetical protein
LVVTNAVKISSSRSRGNPAPVSRTEMTSCRGSAADVMVSSFRPLVSFMASMPLRIRFMTTYCDWTASAMIGDSVAVSSVRIGSSSGSHSAAERPYRV